MVVYAFHGFPVKILTWQIRDENKAAYNVSHFLLILLLVNDFWYVNAVIHQGYFLDMLVTVSCFSRIKLSSENSPPDSPMTRILVRTHKVKI